MFGKAYDQNGIEYRLPYEKTISVWLKSVFCSFSKQKSSIKTIGEGN